MSLANIAKDIRAQLTRGTWILVAYIPTGDFSDAAADTAENKTQEGGIPGILRKRLFHRCLTIITMPLQDQVPRKILDADGFWRRVVFIVMIYIADMEEQYLLACLASLSCPQCCARSGDLGASTPCEARSSESILQDIAAVRSARGDDASLWSFTLGARHKGLNGVLHPFWKNLPHTDICQLLSQEVLHSYHKFFWDHPFKWNMQLAGPREMDLRLRSLPLHLGMRRFPKGISHISQMSGKEHRALERTHVGVIAGAPKVTPDVVKATRAMMDYIYLAQLPSHSETTLRSFGEALRRFHEYKEEWVKLEARRGKEDNVITNLNGIPKLHNPHHFVRDVEESGTSDNFNAEAPEHCHIEDLKNAYPHTNHRNFQTQTVRWLVRRDAIREFTLYQAWIDREWPKSDPLDDEDIDENGGDGDEVQLAVHSRPQTSNSSTGSSTTPSARQSPISRTLRLNKRPSLVAYKLTEAAKLFDIPTLSSDILRYLQRTGRRDLVTLPPEFQYLNVWYHVRVLSPTPNSYYKPEWYRLRALPAINNQPSFSDAVLLAEGDESIAKSGLKGEICMLHSCGLVVDYDFKVIALPSFG